MEKISILEGVLILHERGFLYIFAFAMGASIGSFLNVVIYRWPEEKSIVSPGSHCPFCDTPIPLYWNIPVFSWLILRGKCRWCSHSISIQYLIVELVIGLWAVLCLYKFGPHLETVVYFSFGAALFCGSVIDIHTRLLPDFITLGFIPVGILMGFLYQPTHMAHWPVTGLDSVIGIAVGSGMFLGVNLLFKLVTGKEGMGMGDVKLMGGIGAMLGYAALPAVILLASVGGIVTWLILWAFKFADKDYPVPFGPFLSFGTLFVIFAREWLVKYMIIIDWGILG